MKWPLIDMEEMIEKGLIKLGRGKVISKLDIAECPGPFPIYSSAQMNNGKFGEYGKYMFDQELITWSVDGGGQLFYRPKHKFSVTNVAGTLEILDSSQLDCKYLHYVLSDKHSRLKFDWIQKAHPSVIRRLYKEIPLPPLDDQKRIAHLLGKVEGLIARRKQHLQQLDDLLKSVFLEMFGDPVRNEKGWDKPELKHFGKISTGNTPPRKDPSNFSSQHIEWIKTDNISSDSFFISHAAEYLSEAGAIRARTVRKGALMVACIAGSVESIGRAALTNRTVAFNQQINAIQPKKDVNPFYLYVLFKISKAYIQSHASKGMKKILTKGDFEKITMIKPPVDHQNQFAAVVEKVEGLKSRYQQSLTDLENLYGALSQKAFKGELDLSRVPLPAEAPDKAEEQALRPEAVPLDIAAQIQRFSTLDLPAMSSKDTRRNMLKQWFDEWLNGATASEELSPEGFWERARISALDYQGEDDQTNEFFSEDYDLFKDWLFSAIERGLIRQTRNTVEGEEGADFGNRVILRKAD